MEIIKDREHSKSECKLKRRAGLICVSKLSNRVNKQHLYEIFSPYGDIKAIFLQSDPLKIDHNRSFIEYEEIADAEEAYNFMNGAFLDGNNLEVIKLHDLYKD